MLNVLLFCVNINYILGAPSETGVGRLISQEKALHSTGPDGNFVDPAVYEFLHSEIEETNIDKHLESSSLGDTRRRLPQTYIYQTVPNIVKNWVLALTLDGDGTAEYDLGELQFNSLAKHSYEFIIKRECPSCSADYQTIYYKRYTDPANFDAYGHMKDWSSTDNVLGIDFNLYSTLSDALSDNRQNAWKYCNYNDPGIGAFRDCGKTGSVYWQWTSQSRGGQKASFYVYMSCTLCNADEQAVDIGDYFPYCFPHCMTGWIPVGSGCVRPNSNNQGNYQRFGRMANQDCAYLMDL